jgi:hypothetical protein
MDSMKITEIIDRMNISDKAKQDVNDLVAELHPAYKKLTNFIFKVGAVYRWRETGGVRILVMTKKSDYPFQMVDFISGEATSWEVSIKRYWVKYYEFVAPSLEDYYTYVLPRR